MNIPFSNQYLHDVKALYKERAEKRITGEVFSQRLDELREKEAQSQEPVGHILIMQQIEATQKEIEAEVQKELEQKKRQLEIEERAKKAERSRQMQKQWQEQQAEQKRQDLEQEKRARARDDYTSEMDTYTNRLESNAQQWQRWYTWLQIILLFFSALTATMAGIEGIPRLVVSGAGFIATVAGSLLTTFKIQERIYASRKAVAEVRLERQKYDYHIEEYKDLDTEEAFVKLSRSISSIQGQQMLQEVELWNPKREEQKQAVPAPIQQELRDTSEQTSQEELDAEEGQVESLTTNTQADQS